MTALLLAVLAAGPTGAQEIEAPTGPLLNPIVSKSKEKEEWQRIRLPHRSPTCF